MALKQARITQSISEKRYLTMQLIESAVMLGSPVKIYPVTSQKISELNAESFEYNKDDDGNLIPLETYVIFDERPKPQLLQRLGWYREDAENVPLLAYIPTHLIREIKEQPVGEPGDPGYTPAVAGDVINYIALEGDDFSQLIENGITSDKVLEPLKITRGALMDVHYDFMPHLDNRFYVTDVKVDQVSLFYIANLMPYKYQHDIEGEEDSNTPYLDIDTSKVGI